VTVPGQKCSRRIQSFDPKSQSMLKTLAALSVVAVLGAQPALSQGWGDAFSPREARDARQNGDIVPLRDIFRRLEREYGGYQISAELFSKRGGGSEYHIQWMTERGRKMRFVVDAQSGRVTQSS